MPSPVALNGLGTPVEIVGKLFVHDCYLIIYMLGCCQAELGLNLLISPVHASHFSGLVASLRLKNERGEGLSSQRSGQVTGV